MSDYNLRNKKPLETTTASSSSSSSLLSSFTSLFDRSQSTPAMSAALAKNKASPGGTTDLHDESDARGKTSPQGESHGRGATVSPPRAAPVVGTGMCLPSLNIFHKKVKRNSFTESDGLPLPGVAVQILSTYQCNSSYIIIVLYTVCRVCEVTLRRRHCATTPKHSAASCPYAGKVLDFPSYSPQVPPAGRERMPRRRLFWVESRNIDQSPV